MTVTPEILAYCAGVVDSDGTIGIQKKQNRPLQQCLFVPHVRVKQVEPQAVAVFRDAFGGSVFVEKPYSGGRRAMFVWFVAHGLAENTLRAILPYLRIKREQAENALSLRDTIAESKALRVSGSGYRRRPDHITRRMEQSYLRAKELNAARSWGAVL